MIGCILLGRQFVADGNHFITWLGTSTSPHPPSSRPAASDSGPRPARSMSPPWPGWAVGWQRAVFAWGCPQRLPTLPCARVPLWLSAWWPSLCLLAPGGIGGREVEQVLCLFGWVCFVLSNEMFNCYFLLYYFKIQYSLAKSNLHKSNNHLHDIVLYYHFYLFTLLIFQIHIYKSNSTYAELTVVPKFHLINVIQLLGNLTVYQTGIKTNLA